MDAEFLKEAVKGIADPYILAVVVISCVFIYNLPKIISTIYDVRRQGKINDMEVEAKRKVLDSQLKSLEDKRLAKKRRGRK